MRIILSYTAILLPSIRILKKREQNVIRKGIRAGISTDFLFKVSAYGRWVGGAGKSDGWGTKSVENHSHSISTSRLDKGLFEKASDSTLQNCALPP
jgi:hypothetical protein